MGGVSTTLILILGITTNTTTQQHTMSKQNISATVDPEVAAYLQRDSVNASGLVNKLVKEHMNSGGPEAQMVQLRLEQVRSQRESMETRVEQKREEETVLEERLNQLKEDKQSVIRDAAEALQGTRLDPDNPAVQNWAEKAGMDPEDFISELEEVEE